MSLKNKKVWIIGGSVVVLVLIYIIAILTGNTKQQLPESSTSGQVPSSSTSNNGLTKHTEIIWKDDEEYGIANLYLDGTKTKEGIIASYYTEMSNYIKSLDVAQLKDYKYVEFTGNVVQQDKIECTIRGRISIDYIKSNPSVTAVELEENITDLFIPAPLQ